MENRAEQVLAKTPQGLKATRSGEGLASKSHALLKLFDGNKSVAELKQLGLSASFSEADIEDALIELRQFDYLHVVDVGAAAVVSNTEANADFPAKAKAEADVERKMLLTLDFTMPVTASPQKSPAVKPMASANPAVSSKPAAAAAALKPVVSPAPARPAAAAVTAPAAVAKSVTAPARAAPGLDAEARAREEKTARLKAEAEIHQKLVAALQPKVEEELRTRLRSELEAELRPKLIAALRPGVEAQLRTTLIEQLTPRIELELKARFAKTMAAQRAANQQAPRAEVVVTPPKTVVPAAPVDNEFERLLASMNMPLFSVDMEGNCAYISPAWAQFSGYSVAEAVGKPLADCFSDADRRAVSDLLKGIASGTALHFEQQGALLRKEGGPLWVEINAAPLYSNSGKIMGVCGAMRDAVELRRVNAQAEADGVRLLLLVDQIDTGILLEDGDGNIQQANSALCALLSLDAAPYSLEGMAVTELLNRVSKGFIGPEGFLRRVGEIRSAGEDAKGESFVMADGRVIQQDYLAVTVDENTVGRVWLFREMPRTQARAAP